VIGNWESIYEYWKDKTGTPTSHTNQTRQFFEDDGTVLWVTFEGGCLYYAYSDGGVVMPDVLSDGDTTAIRKTSADGWRNTDANSEVLRIENLSGRLTKTAGFRQTICGFSADVETYLRSRIAGTTNPAIALAQDAQTRLVSALEVIIKTFTWPDFELFVELIFAQSGLRRVSRTGGSQKTTDLDLENPITGELAFVQVKSQTSQNELNTYIQRKANEKAPFRRMYYVYHSGFASSEDEEVTVWNASMVARKALESGLSDWVITKAK
jgi:hypothetical protein